MPDDIDALREQLSDSKGGKRASACKKLGKALAKDTKIATPQLLKELAAKTRDKSDTVSMAAAEALAGVGAAAVEPLIEMLKLDRLPKTEAEVTDDDSIAHSNISGALGKIADPRCVDAMLAIAKSQSRGNVGAICGLGDLAKQGGSVGVSAGNALGELSKAGASADPRIAEVAQSMLAEIKGDGEEVQEAVSSGDVDKKNELGRSLLYLAADSLSLSSVEKLIKEGADLNAADCNGFTPMIGLLSKASNYEKLPEEARQILDALIAAGADVNAKTSNGRTALFFAFDLKMVKALLKAGAEVNVKDEEGWTPLHGLVYRGKAPIAKLLIKEGADVNAENAKGKTAYDMLATNRKKMEALLAEAGAKV